MVVVACGPKKVEKNFFAHKTDKEDRETFLSVRLIDAWPTCAICVPLHSGAQHNYTMKLRVGAFAALLVLPCAAQSELTATCLKLEDGTGAQQTICGDNLKVQQSVDESYSIFDKISGLATCLSSEINSTPGTRTINGVAFTSATSLFCHSPSLSVCNKNTYGDCMAKVVVDVSSMQAKCPGNLVFSAWAGIRACPGVHRPRFSS